MSSRHLVVLMLGAAASALAAAQTGGPLATPRGFEAGVQLSGYRYTEPEIDVRIDGGQFGGRFAYTFGITRAMFGRVDARLAYGELEYSGSGTAEAQPNSIFEVRNVFGRDHYVAEGLMLTPYVGIGYRSLYSDLRGQSSTGAVGYRRYSRYLYLPIGLAARFNAEDQWVVAPTIEYDHFIRGKQETKLTDTGIAGLPDVENTQRKGVGYRASLMFENGQFSFGPWFHVWRIKDSDIVRISPTEGLLEPKNETKEAGVEVNYRF
ncbi:MAG TPA: hypothetical protein VFH22_05715 [Rhodocyclaceae bacterium]|nr:hypothetical protein [Rhodocyclaceae bacterium]